MNSFAYYIERCSQSIIEKSIASPFITTVLGPRRVGKSTLITHLTAQLPNPHRLYLNMVL